MSIQTLTNSKSPFQWIDITAPSAEELIAIGDQHNIHSYEIRDCLEPDHLPKIEVLENHTFIISRLMIETNPPNKDIHTIQELTSKVAIFFNETSIITVHRLPLEFMAEINAKYIENKKISSNELVVRILWYVLKTYESRSQFISEEIDLYEEKIFLRSLSSAMMKNLYFIKRKTHLAYKLLIQTDSIIRTLETKDKTALHDLKDNSEKLISFYHQNMEDVNNLLNFYLSISSQKTNEVMRVLTIFSAFFLPLTFLAGIYGMNFDYLPELHFKYGYLGFWAISILIVLVIYQWFWRKKWL